MAFEVSPDYEVPQATMVTSYKVTRLGINQTATFAYGEVVPCVSAPFTVVDVLDTDEDDAFETLVVSGITDVDYVVGSTLLNEAGEPVSVVAAWTETNPMEGTMVLAEPQPTAALKDTSVSLSLIGSAGTQAYRLAKGGRSYEAILDLSNPAAREYATRLLFNVFAEGASRLIAKLIEQGVTDLTTVDETVLANALLALAAEGHNLDAFIGRHGEQFEMERRAKLLPFVKTTGAAPN